MKEIGEDRYLMGIRFSFSFFIVFKFIVKYAFLILSKVDYGLIYFLKLE